MTIRLLVFGGSGQVGSELRHLADVGQFEADFPARSEVDITSADAVRQALRAARYHVVVNTAAFTDVDGAEASEAAAQAVNATAAGIVAQAAAERGLPVVHLSTDYVFDGTKGAPYVESDPVAPLGVYGRTKEAGERAVRDANLSHVILRTAWVFSPFGRNFVKTMLRAATDRDELRVVDDQQGTPTNASDIARAISAVAHRLVQDPAESALYGTFHYAGGVATTWYKFANAIFEESRPRGGPWARLAPIRTDQYPTAARRPADSRLDSRKIERVYGIGPAVWCAGLCDTLDRLFDAVGPQSPADGPREGRTGGTTEGAADTVA